MTSERPASLFERPAVICYCVPGGASQCAPCRDRRSATAVPAAPKVFIGKKKRGAELDGPCIWFACDGIYREVHYGDSGCSCHISPPCSWCVDTTLACDKCGDEGDD